MIKLSASFLIFVLACSSVIAMNNNITVFYPGYIIAQTSDEARFIRAQETKQFPYGTECHIIKITLEKETGINRHDQILFNAHEHGKPLGNWEKALFDLTMYIKNELSKSNLH